MRRVCAALLFTVLLSGCAAPADDEAAASPSTSPAPTETASPGPTESTSEATEQPSSEPTGQRALADDVEVTLTCERGDGVDTLPFDPAYADGFDQEVPADTTWVRQVLTITNSSDSWIQVAPEFTTVYLDEAGERIATGVHRAIEPVLAAGPGEVVQDTLTEYEDVRGLLAVEQADEPDVFARLASCEVEDVAVTETDPLEVDPDLLQSGPATMCSYIADGSLLLAEWPATNVSDEEIIISGVLAVRDGDGRRLHTIPGGAAILPPDEEFSLEATAFRQNLSDPEADVTCEMLTTTEL